MLTEKGSNNLLHQVEHHWRNLFCFAVVKSFDANTAISANFVLITKNSIVNLGLIPKISNDWLERKDLVSLWRLLTYLCRTIGVFPKWNRNSVNLGNSGNLINHGSMNWSQFKDPVSHTCLVGAVVASWSLTQEVAG